jgi:RNA polymerase sigma factor (TIGR02999 family)
MMEEKAGPSIGTRGSHMSLATSADEIAAELHAVASAHFAHERANHTLQPTAIVSEVWLRLMLRPDLRFESMTAFKAFASRVVRNILVDHARAKRSAKRGGASAGRVALESLSQDAPCASDDTLALDEALAALEQTHPRMARIVELRFFGGLTEDEAAAELGISPRTARTEWAIARGWLHARLRAGE